MWVCSECGLKHGTRSPVCATWHEDTCGVCGAVGPVTEARDFGGNLHCCCLEDILDAADALEALREAETEGTISLEELRARLGRSA